MGGPVVLLDGVVVQAPAGPQYEDKCITVVAQMP
ncbi:hypothetical protein L195_g031292 [Trifolium pratense]|uniref:Uncharacterized protein n=1 Tax=Trifolium pratense TaxID=57577 RepID=A0A2K3LA01_TRIPR|nr:hypothetical protein L195_g031292 [Trifolium pratense]